ncbi:hypothetical protein [Streptomyces goshikiensis]|uniref:hypothetical protein n=1 Tax=Streptomyces goshikiensis TaxID=1942 RepID=UPI002ADFF49B|nr:hypothetical protein [Streptomyces goshikiensis]
MASPLQAPADEEPSAAAVLAPPAPQEYEDDEEALQRTSCIRRSYAAPLHRTGLVLPDAAFLLLTILVTVLMCAAAAAFSKIASAAGNPR